MSDIQCRKASPLGYAASIYAAYVVLLLARFPLRGTLPGNCDSWLAIGLSKSIQSAVLAVFFPNDVGTAFFPLGHPYLYGESAPLGAALLMGLRGLGLGDVLSYSAFLVVGLSATAVAIFALGRSLGLAFVPALYSGFAFASSNFSLANLDDSVVVFYALPVLSLLLVEMFRHTHRPWQLYGAALALGVQAYLSVYVFLYGTCAVGAMAWGAIGRCRGTRRPAVLAGLILVGVAAPVLVGYPLLHHLLGVVDPASGAASSMLEVRGLAWSSILKPLPGNFLYDAPPLADGAPFWMDIRTRAFLGYGTLALAALGAVWSVHRRRLLVLLLLGLGLSIGTSISIAGLTLHPPMYYVYAYVPLSWYVRLPFRAFFLAALAISLLAGFGLQRVIAAARAHRGFASAASCIALLVLFVENVPSPLPAFPAAEFLTPPAIYDAIPRGDKPRVILDLPSVGFGPEQMKLAHQPLFPYNRELIYMNWQYEHRQHIMGGVHGYPTAARLELYDHIRMVPASGALDYLKGQGLEFIVFHSDLVLPGEEGGLATLESSPRLVEVAREGEAVLFRLREGEQPGPADMAESAVRDGDAA